MSDPKEKYPESIYHAILNAFRHCNQSVIGTRDIVEYCHYSEYELRNALMEMEEEKILQVTEVGGVYVWELYSGSRRSPSDEELRNQATKLSNNYNE